MTPLTLELLPGRLAICRLPPAAAIPPWAGGGALVSLTRTAEEFSIVCEESAVPDDTQCERGWRALKVRGPLDIALTGILASIAAPLAGTVISLFAVSTFDTDYVLVKESSLDAAVDALRAAGHTIYRP